MFLFNKREVYNGWSLNDFCTVRDTLDEAGIRSRYKAIDNIGSRRMGSLGYNMDYARTYIVYVKKQDFEQAQFVLSKKR